TRSGAPAQAAVAQATPAPTSQAGSAKNRPGAKRLALLLGRATVEVSGIDRQELLAGLRDGKSLAQIAQEHGKTAGDVIAAARARLQDRLKQAVANGRLTQARADQMLAHFDQSAPQVMNDQSLGRQVRRAIVKRHPLAAGLVKATAEVTGLQPKDVLAGLRAGKSLAQIAQEHGKTGDDILAKARELGQQRLDKALERAEELIDQPGLGRGQGAAEQP
ncbi:MAG TPA: hypothetical protein VFO85_07865, partial [Vicinamibacteria bacterium]|nr:hypothetical protein [Vicinamibacteria bacterium]